MTELFQKIDHAIKMGEHDKARKALAQIAFSDSSRQELTELADFGRRVRWPLYSLKALSKVMKSCHDNVMNFQDVEIFSYTKALVKLGFFDEALRWMVYINDRNSPEIFDLKGRIQMSQWNYASACFFFERFLTKIDSSDYTYLVARVNLGAAYVGSNQWEKAREHLLETQKVAQAGGHRLIFANCHELLAQASILSGETHKGLTHLEKSAQLLNSNHNIYFYYLRKWKWIADAINKSDADEGLQLGHQLKEDAILKNYWEDVRHIDKILATHFGQTDLAVKNYFGTRFTAYRDSLKQTCLDLRSLPPNYLWRFSSSTSKKPYVFVIEDVAELTVKVKLLFKCLTKDFYRPLPIGYLFTKLYPEESFDPNSSPDRIYRTVARLRKILPSELSILWNPTGVQLKGQGSISIRIEEETKTTPEKSEKLRILRNQLKRKWFNSQDVAQAMSLSQRSALRLIKEARKSYKVEENGTGRSKRYRFTG